MSDHTTGELTIMLTEFRNQNSKEHKLIIDKLDTHDDRITKLEKAKWYGQGVITVILFMVSALFIPILLQGIGMLMSKL